MIYTPTDISTVHSHNFELDMLNYRPTQNSKLAPNLLSSFTGPIILLSEPNFLVVEPVPSWPGYMPM